MRAQSTNVFVAFILLCSLRSPLCAQDSARKLIERAIAAHGGMERLSKVRADKVHLQGKLVLVAGKEGSQEFPFTAETTVQLPAQFRNVVQLSVGGDKKFTLIQIFNKDKAIVTINGQLQEIKAEAMADMRETMNLDRAIRLVPLLQEEGYELALVGESKVNERSATAVKVTTKGSKELRLFFDNATGLLIKTEHIHDDGNGKETRQEEYYGDFKDLGGYRRPTKVAAFRDGKKIMEAELVDVKYLDRIDSTEFDKP